MATRLQLRTYARSRADQDSSTFPTDAQYNEYLNKAGARVYRRLVALGWKPNSDGVTITADGSVGYDLDTAIMSVTNVYRMDGNTPIPLRRILPEEMPHYFGRTGTAERYELTGGATSVHRIALHPAPASGTYLVYFTNRFPGFTSDASVWYGPEGSDELIILDAAAQGAAKEQSGMESDLRAQLKDAWGEVMASADWLDANHPGRVRDVRVNNRRDSFDWDAEEGLL